MLRIMMTALLTLPFLSTAAQSEDNPKARAIIDRAIEAGGGTDALKKQRHIEVEDKGFFYGMGEELPYRGKVSIAFPDKFRMEILGVFTIVNTGKEMWVSSNGASFPVTGDPLKYEQEEMEAGYISSLIPLEKPNPKYELSLFGEEEVDGETCDGVNVKRGDRPTVTMFFSQKTGLMRRFQTVVHNEQQEYKEVVETTVYSDFKEVDGVTLPMKTVITRDGKKFVVSEAIEVSFPEKFPEDHFAKPKGE